MEKQIVYGEGAINLYVFSTHDTHSELCDAIRIAKGYRKEKWGYFLRAESFYIVANLY
ncbi:putative uncharacterized protein [Clostridium sp. CAG:590]|nr:putative uncharacterized protein [Clostridium sp. CAG:590]